MVFVCFFANLIFSGNLLGENEARDSRAGETQIEDMVIRRFVHGIFPEKVMSEIIIKRRHNLIVIACIIQTMTIPGEMHKVYFLVGYAEKILSEWLHRPIKFELQSIQRRSDTTYKYL